MANHQLVSRHFVSGLLVASLVAAASLGCGGGSGHSSFFGGSSTTTLAPSFAAISDQAVVLGTTPPAVTISSVTAGSSTQDATETVSFTLTSSNTAVVTNLGVNGSGSTRTLTYQTATSAGTATVTVLASNGTQTFSRTFNVVVTATPTPSPSPSTAALGPQGPSVTNPGSQTSLTKTSGTIPLTGIGPGSGSGPVTLSVSANPSTFLTNLSVSGVSGSSATISYTTGATVGSTTIVVTANNGASSNNLTTISFPLSIVSVSFSANATFGKIPLASAFTGVVTGGTASSLTWNYGDTGTATGATPPAHSYGTAGVYDVSLTAVVNGTSLVVKKTNYIVAGTKLVSPTIGGADSATIQGGITGAPTGAVIAVGPGTYDESLTIASGQNVTIAGPFDSDLPPTLGNLTAIVRPTTLPTTTPQGDTAFVDVGLTDDSATTQTTVLNLSGIGIDASTTENVQPGTGDYGVLFHAGASGSVTNSVINGVRQLVNFGDQTGLAINVRNGNATGATYNFSNNLITNFQKVAIAIHSNDPGTGTTLGVTIAGNTIVGTDPVTTLSTQQSENGIELLNNTNLNLSNPDPLPDTLVMTAAITGNTFQQFGTAGVQQDWLGHGADATDSSYGVAVLIAGLGKSSPVTVTGNTFTECQGIMYDDRDVSTDTTARPSAVKANVFLPANTITGGRFVVAGALNEAATILGQRADDPDVINYVILLFFSTTTPQYPTHTIVVGSGTYTLTDNLSNVPAPPGSYPPYGGLPTPISPASPSFGTLTITSFTGTANIQYPAGSCPYNTGGKLVAGSGVTFTPY